MPKTVVCLPSPSELALPTAWRQLGKNRYSARRLVILVVKRRLDKAVNGPELQTASYPPGSKYTLTTRKVVTSKLTESIQRTAERTISSTISNEFLAKQTADVGLAATGPSLSFGQESSEKIATVLTTAAKDALAEASSYEIQNAEEVTRSIEVDAGAAASGAPLSLSLHLKLYVWYFDFYLVRIDELEIEYKRRLLGLIAPVRRRIKSVSDSRALPLFRLRTYEPIDNLSLAKGEYRADVGMDDSAAVHVEPLADPAPPFSLAAIVPLEESAKLAFPKTAAERKKPAAKKAPAKKAGVSGPRSKRKPVVRRAPTRKRAGGG